MSATPGLPKEDYATDEPTSGAVLSPCGRYRYRLWRELPRGKGSATIVMLNPSTADASKDDHTIRKLLGFAERRWGVGRIEVVNLFALIETDSKKLHHASYPTGPENDHYLDEAVCESGSIIVAWGALHKSLEWRARDVLDLIRKRVEPLCLGRCGNGQPRHPLMLSYETELEIYR